MTDSRFPRHLVSRRGLLIGGATLAFAAPALAQGEGGEAGEGAATMGLPGEVEFLVALGLFEAMYRLVGAMVAQGARAEAIEQLETSHHAHYDDLVEPMNARGIAPFESAVSAFAAAVTGDAATDTIAARLAEVLAPIAAIRAGATPADRMHANEALVRVAAADFEGGVDSDGTMLSDHEYHDAWGFFETARADLVALAASPDATVAEAARRALAALEPVAAQFPALMATEVPGADPSVIHGAAARIEIARLHL